MSDRSATPPDSRAGLGFGIAAYACWGVLPLYLRLLADVPSGQIVAHRIIWSLLLLAVAVLALRRWPALRAAARGRTLGLLCLSAMLIAVNWVVFMWAVQHGHVLETSLGYFMNPLVSVALGVGVLGERLRRVQAAAIALAGCGVLVLLLSGGGAVWISLMLALSFGCYGLVRKVAAIDALGGLLVETAVLLGPALAYLYWVGADNRFGAGTGGITTRDVLLVLAGPVTAVPLLLFAAAARRVKLATLGLLQYIAPTLQFAEAVLIFGEPLRPAYLVTFALIWAGLALYAVDAVRGARAAVAVPE
jgi:chloramphenicol-sensitive protein RarD